ncbi:MAG: DUF1573 domain-containing protein [Aeoliella sp.]
MGGVKLVNTVFLIVALAASWSSVANAQEWPKKMFEKLDHDFGTVARGSDTIYKFEITNKFVEDIQISSVRSSCGCTSPTIENKLIKTYEKAYIVAKFNTRTFTGLHSATLTVTINKPYPAQVQLRVHGNIRGDVVFKPGSVSFNAVDQGTAREQRIGVTYAGRSGWQIQDVVTNNESSEFYEVELTETQRVGGLVKYDLLVRLKETAPAGYIKDQLVLVTSDNTNPRIPLDIEGRVTPEISVAPENLVLGEIVQGNEVPKKLIVRGKKDFKITQVECEEDCFSFEYDAQPRKTHVVSVNFNAGADTGRLKKAIRVHTDLGETYTAVCTAYATIVDPPKPSEEGAEVAAESGDSATASRSNGESPGNLAENR